MPLKRIGIHSTFVYSLDDAWRSSGVGATDRCAAGACSALKCTCWEARAAAAPVPSSKRRRCPLRLLQVYGELRGEAPGRQVQVRHAGRGDEDHHPGHAAGAREDPVQVPPWLNYETSNGMSYMQSLQPPW